MSAKSRMNSRANKRARINNNKKKAATPAPHLIKYTDDQSRFMGYNYERRLKRIERNKND